MLPIVDILSIGHLSRNEFWGETEPVRSPLATTTLVRSGDTCIVVDPSLPADWMRQKLFERSGLKPEQIDAVFLTSFHPTHRRALEIFDDAICYVHEAERDAVSQHLESLLEDDDHPHAVEKELAILGRTEPAPDILAQNVHLFPSPGVTPGSAGLLVAGLQTTVVIGDSILTRDHFEHGRVYELAVDPDQAAKSIAEVYEIADHIVPGHDNIVTINSPM